VDRRGALRAGLSCLAAADELDNLDLRTGIERRRSPQVALHDDAVEFDGDTFRLETECPQNVFQRNAGREKVAFPVDRNLILF